MIIVSKSISKLTQLHPPTAYQSLITYALHVYLDVNSVTIGKYTIICPKVLPAASLDTLGVH